MKVIFRIILLIIILTIFPVKGAPVPDKTIVLTFDDAVISHLTVVAPILKEYGFGATFFVSQAWLDDTEHFLTWEKVAELYQMGFEIGNHSWTHRGFNSPRNAALLAGELALVEYELEQVGIPKPVSFAWTGNSFGPEAREVLHRAGYKYARRGMQPEVDYGLIREGPLYDPEKNHPLLIPTTGDAYPDWTLDHFKKVVNRAYNGKIVVLQFHGVPDIVHPWVHTPVDRFKEYMVYLKENGFNVIPLKGVSAFVPEEGIPSDPMLKERYSPWLPTEVRQTRKNIDFWLGNMILHHGYSIPEAIQVSGMAEHEINRMISELDLKNKSVSQRDESGKIKVLPYPGGRHPRIGFLEGAVSPQRGTKVTIFSPWEEGDYVVLDLPEAIFSNLGLTFLAHTHIPTIWDKENKTIDNIDWIVDEGGVMRMERNLPNGISFGAVVEPGINHVSLELWLENGSESMLTDLRTQVCLLLKGAKGFNEQSDERKEYLSPFAAVKSKKNDHWILIAFENCGTVWGNSKCPCIHSDPILPDASAGQRVSVKGRIWFYEGKNVHMEMDRGIKF
jgi:peptidoglycan/xylan/chitin deacetylase (PgdA/CDA1 family)